MVWIIGIWVVCSVAVFTYSIIEDVRKNKEVLILDICAALFIALLAPLILIAILLIKLKAYLSYDKFMRYRVYKAK